MKILHTGIDTLDIAYQGAMGANELDMLEATLSKARCEKADQRVEIGPSSAPFILKPHGKKGGYRYTLTNGDTGAIYSIKRSHSITDWNLFVSVRAPCLLTRGYIGTKKWLADTLNSMGANTIDHSVNRIDMAFDVHAKDFTLDPALFVCPGSAKVRTKWNQEQHLTNEGETYSSVMTGAKFQSATIGTMPGRQVIVYDKSKAAIDQMQPYWFDVWGLDNKGFDGKVWRVEVRAGRKALEARLGKRTFDNIDADLSDYVARVLQATRYTTNRKDVSNVSRATIHPLWKMVQAIAPLAIERSDPSIPDSRILEIMRKQRAKMSMDQVTGCLVRAAALSGYSEKEVLTELHVIANEAVKRDIQEKGLDWLEKKVRNTFEQVSPLTEQFNRDKAA